MAAAALLADAVGGPFGLAPWIQDGTPGHYDDVNVATGMVAAKLRISVENASLRLCAHAFSQDQSLLDVARAIVQRGSPRQARRCRCQPT